jgi:isoprenylcysteine carboxyl methyltransferase (ICMT) family protein YpbQ
VLVRLVSLFKSIFNEKKLKSKADTVEYGKSNSFILTLAHILYYLGCLLEVITKKVEFDFISAIGLGIFIFSMVILGIIIIQLKEIWTVKLIITSNHTLNQTFLFKYFRHPNYFLNVVPELIGVSLLCHAWYTLAIGLPLYFIPLFIRIKQEEEVMKKKFGDF